MTSTQTRSSLGGTLSDFESAKHRRKLCCCRYCRHCLNCHIAGSGSSVVVVVAAVGAGGDSSVFSAVPRPASESLSVPCIFGVRCRFLSIGNPVRPIPCRVSLW